MRWLKTLVRTDLLSGKSASILQLWVGMGSNSSFDRLVDRNITQKVASAKYG